MDNNGRIYKLLLVSLIFIIAFEIIFISSHFFILRDVFKYEMNYISKSQHSEIKSFSSDFSQKSQATPKENKKETDLMPKPLSNPPKIIKAVYLTGWSAGRNSTIDYLINLSKQADINAVVIDLKDYSGRISYKTSSSLIHRYGGEENKILDINSLIQKLHDNHIYVIGRIVVFQDPILALANPRLAIHDKSKVPFSLSSSTTSSVSSNINNLAERKKIFDSTSSLWTDNRGSFWIDPASREDWQYNLALAQDAAQRGFDEINFDYVRFPSSGKLENMMFPFWQEKTPMHSVIKEFYNYLHQGLSKTKISLDIFGMSTVSSNGLGIGQILEDSFGYFDYVCPMVYPSHFSHGFLGHYNPADYPYEVIKYSMDSAFKELSYFEDSIKSSITSSSVCSTYTTSSVASNIYFTSSSSSSSLNNSYRNISNRRQTQLRPWLQYFDLGAVYDRKMIQSEIKAVEDSAQNHFYGFMLWNPNNIYTKDVLEKVP